MTLPPALDLASCRPCVYESLITEQLQRRLDHAGAVLASEAVPDGDQPDDHLAVASVVA